MATIRLNLVRRPLMHPSVAEECLDLSRANLIAQIESGNLPWAWDLSTRGGRREIRILAYCVIEKVTGIIPEIGATKDLKLPEVIALILPSVRQSLRGAELQRLFHVSSDNVRDLNAAGKIRRLPENLPARGVNASHRYTRQSLARLLKETRIT